MMKGWVYIITNKAMPGLIKIGYSLKDPKLRAAELNHTGSPYPYEVEYEILIPYPRDIEQELHLILNDKRAGKEWFYIDANEVIEIIRKNYGEQIILESKLILESKSITKFAERKWHYDPETASLKNNETEEELSQFQYNVFHQLIITNNHQQISFHEIDGEQHINKFLRIQKGIKHSKSTWVFDLRNKIVIGMSDGKIIPSTDLNFPRRIIQFPQGRKFDNPEALNELSVDKKCVYSDCVFLAHFNECFFVDDSESDT